MKSLISAVLLVVAVSASVLEEQGADFQAFKIRHGKTYKNQAEETKRFNIFQDNLRSIEEHNALYEQGLSTYKQGVTQFADMTSEEFQALLKFRPSNKHYFNVTKHVKTGVTTPSSIDWRSQGQVTGVKDQGSCGGCWAFCVSGSIEAAYYRKSGNLVSLSEQQLIDCSTDINDGCNGGQLDGTYPYVQQNGIESESSYSYVGYDDTCKYSSSKVVTKISGYKHVSTEDDLLDSVGNIGPVATAVYGYPLQHYTSGIIADDCSPQILNHCVLIVGYGSENGQNYWLVKNSWGTSWGEDGYFRVLRGRNECGINEDSAYPIIN